MIKNRISHLMLIIVFSTAIFCVGCETEQQQNVPKNNNAMIGYAQDFARTQAELENQEQLKKLSD